MTLPSDRVGSEWTGTVDRRSTAERRGPLVVAAAVALVAVAVSVALASGAARAGTTNPSQNVAADSNNLFKATDDARQGEGVPALMLNQPAFQGLPIIEQVFTLVNLERTARGLPPMAAMTSQLNASAQPGANAGQDPLAPLLLTGGGFVEQWGSIWAGTGSSLLANYLWMYDDGWGGSSALTSNIACSQLLSLGCWGHRDIILNQYPTCSVLGLSPQAPTLVMGVAYSPTGDPAGSLAAVLESTCGGMPPDVTVTWPQVEQLLDIPSPVVGMAPTPDGRGYWLAGGNGAVQAVGDAQYYGSISAAALNQPVVGLASTPDGRGYWLVAADGGVFSFGDARFYGSTGAIHLNRPIVGMAGDASGRGYWLVASDGGIFAFGDAPFLGSMGAYPLNQPIVGMAVDTATRGYWLVAADGGIFAVHAAFMGSTGGMRLNRPIVGMEAAPNGSGYRLVASDGGVFSFKMPFAGSEAGSQLAQPIVGTAVQSETGYWMVGGDGSVFSFGSAPYLGRGA
ncbi:MAG TPA: hypothetical protein VG412_09210 [Acidimicrobiales bacterium]|nr:hypothetical protein [Acidimicrobiales bacterium]